MDCPKCGSLMIKRRGKNGQFYGCSRFPLCKGTAPIRNVVPERRVVEKTTPRNWSNFQLAIFDAVGKTDKNLVVEAVAGSGKTTTAVAAMNYASRYPTAAFVAFNRKIADDFKSKLPESVHASTYHSLGLKSIRNVDGKIRVEEAKDFIIFNALVDKMSEGSRVLAQDYRSEILRIASLVKNTMAEPSLRGVQLVSDAYNIDTGEEDESGFILSTALKVFQESDRDKSCINFDDMIYWCATGRVMPIAFDLVVTDEMQDTNAARLEMLLKMLRNGGRSIAVGDRRQAIYGWAGAHESAMDAFKEATDATELALSITYRCPLKHVELAQEIVPQIQAREDAPEGQVLYLNGEQEFNANVRDGDMVICRVNAPLVKPAFRMLASGRKAIIVGRDIGANIVALVNRMAAKAENTTSATIMLDEFYEYVGKQTERLERQGKFSKADYLRDQYETTEAIADGCTTVEEVNRKIEGIFSDEQTGVRFSSVHRAKGLEERRVHILRPDVMPMPRVLEHGSAGEIQQEWNIRYVALTRAKETLSFVGGM